MYRDSIEGYYEELFKILHNTDFNHLYSIADKLNKPRNIFVIGNGGSAASASHFVQDLLKTVGVTALSLSDNVSLITAIGNDYGFDHVFSEQLKRYAIPGDILFIISYSGNSQNLINAIYVALDRDVTIISLTGNDGGIVKQNSHLDINVPSDDIRLVESAHSLILHYLIDLSVESAK